MCQRAGSALLSELARDQEGALDAGGIHLRQHLLKRDRLHVLGGAADLLGVEFARPRRPRRNDARGQRIDDDIDCAWIHTLYLR